jgi:hypothetical protein
MFYATIISPKSGGVNRLIASPYDLPLAKKAGIADIFGSLTRAGDASPMVGTD